MILTHHTTQVALLLSRLSYLLLLALLALSTGCDSSSPDPESRVNEAGEPMSQRMEGSDQEPDWSYYQGSDFYLEESHTSIIRQIIFLKEEMPGVVPGFNLDDRVSEDGDEETCGHPDLEDPDGRPGIDNQFATLFRILSAIVEDTPQVAIQGAINEGRVLMMIELLGVDSLEDDEDVTLRYLELRGVPL